MFLEISQNSQENTCAGVYFLIKLQALGLQLYLKKRLCHRCFLVNFAKFLKQTFFTEHLRTSVSKLKQILIHGYSKNFKRILALSEAWTKFILSKFFFFIDANHYLRLSSPFQIFNGRTWLFIDETICSILSFYFSCFC